MLTVNLYDAIWGDRVSCELPEELKPHVLKAAGKRVLITGVVRTDAAGRPRNVRVKTIQELPGRDELPQSLEGIDPDYTGGLDVGEYAKTRWSGSAT